MAARVLQGAVPQAYAYDKANYQKDGQNNQTNVESPEVQTEIPSTRDAAVEANQLRVARSRFSYELNRYTKNTLLIFEGNSSNNTFDNQTVEIAPETEDICAKLKQTFQKYRFEVDVHSNLNDEEIASTCERFFQRDFTEYGCVAVVMLAKTKDGIVESSHTPKSEFGVMRYLTDLLPSTLRNKPKIYIVQTEGFYVIPRARVWSTLPQDNLELRLPVPIVSAPDASGKISKICCLLEYIHEKINNLADLSDLHTILHDAVQEFCRAWQIYDLPVGFYSSLTKELLLARAPEYII